MAAAAAAAAAAVAWLWPWPWPWPWLWPWPQRKSPLCLISIHIIIPVHRGRLDWPCLTHVDQPRRYESLNKPFESMQVALRRLTEPLRISKVERKGRPRRPEIRCWIILKQFSDRCLSLSTQHCVICMSCAAKVRQDDNKNVRALLRVIGASH